MNLWRAELARLFRTMRWAGLAASYVVFGILMPIVTRYQEALFRNLGGEIRVEAPPPTPSLAIASFVATDCEGMARVDCFVLPDGEVVVNELNTIPGFTSTSVYAKLFEASGIPYAELLDRLIALALERHERRRALAY